jgi:hypothetical protein
MADLLMHEIAVLLLMFNDKIIGKKGYVSLQKARKKIGWQRIASKYGIKISFDNVARKLVKKRLLSDDGKSLSVIYLDKFGVDFVIAYIEEHPMAIEEIQG